jgi:hypothetical protein
MTHRAFRHLEKILDLPIASRNSLMSEKVPTIKKSFLLTTDYISVFIGTPKNYTKFTTNRKNY